MPPGEIVMYARDRYCPDVQRSRDRLAKLKIEWIEYDIESDVDAATKVEKLTGQRRVPTLVIGDSILVEPSNDELDRALKNFGRHISVHHGSN